MSALAITKDPEGSFLANGQHEMYARARAAGFSQTESAKRANYAHSTCPNVGCRLEKRLDVQQRIRELAVTISPGVLASKQWVVLELLENHRLARKEKNIMASKACLELVARLQGFLVERRESDSRQLRINVSTPAELRDVLRAQVDQLPSEERPEIEGEVAIDPPADVA
jgi:phage terminase small subunit